MIVGTPRTSAASLAEIRFLTACAVGKSTFPPMCPHFFSEESWSSKCTPAAPASIMAFISSKTLSAPPNPASASATMGANQWMPFLPSAWWTWSALCSAWLILLTTCGTLLAGYRLWSGYMWPARLASAATCQPLR